MSRAWLVAVLLLLGGVARADRPTAAPPPDGPGVHNRPLGTDNRRMVGVLEVRVAGLSDEVRDSFQRQLEDLIDNKRYRLAAHDYVKRTMMRSTRWTDGCVIGRCLADLHAHTGADLILLAALTGSGTNFGYVVTLIRTDTGHVVDQESDRCDVCTVSEVMSRATLAAVGLLNNAPDRLPDEAAEQTAAIQHAADASRRELAAHDRHAARVGIALLVIGLVGAAAGGALYLLDDSHPTYSVATAAGGAAMAAGGIIVLAF